MVYAKSESEEEEWLDSDWNKVEGFIRLLLEELLYCKILFKAMDCWLYIYYDGKIFLEDQRITYEEEQER